MAQIVTFSSTLSGKIQHGQVFRQSWGVVMDESLCIFWPHNDCLFLQDIRGNDLDHTVARPHFCNAQKLQREGERREPGWPSAHSFYLPT